MSVPDDRKIFSDGEIAVILQKAAELQAEGGGRASGLSLEELRQVASEAGIEPHLVEEALRQMHEPAPPPAPVRQATHKGRTRWEQRVELPVRLDNEAVRAVVAHLEAEFGGQGVITELSCGTVWTHYGMRAGHTHASIEARDAGTRFHLALERGSQRKFLRRLGSTVGATLLGIAGIATEDPAAFVILSSIGLVAGNLVGRGAWRVLAPRWAGRLDRMMSTLSGEAMRNDTPLSTESHTPPGAATVTVAGEATDR